MLPPMEHPSWTSCSPAGRTRSSPPPPPNQLPGKENKRCLGRRPAATRLLVALFVVLHHHHQEAVADVPAVVVKADFDVNPSVMSLDALFSKMLNLVGNLHAPKGGCMMGGTIDTVVEDLTSRLVANHPNKMTETVEEAQTVAQCVAVPEEGKGRKEKLIGPTMQRQRSVSESAVTPATNPIAGIIKRERRCVSEGAEPKKPILWKDIYLARFKDPGSNLWAAKFNEDFYLPYILKRIFSFAIIYKRFEEEDDFLEKTQSNSLYGAIWRSVKDVIQPPSAPPRYTSKNEDRFRYGMRGLFEEASRVCVDMNLLEVKRDDKRVVRTTQQDGSTKVALQKSPNKDGPSNTTVMVQQLLEEAIKSKSTWSDVVEGMRNQSNPEKDLEYIKGLSFHDSAELMWVIRMKAALILEKVIGSYEEPKAEEPKAKAQDSAKRLVSYEEHKAKAQDSAKRLVEMFDQFGDTEATEINDFIGIPHRTTEQVLQLIALSATVVSNQPHMKALEDLAILAEKTKKEETWFHVLANKSHKAWNAVTKFFYNLGRTSHPVIPDEIVHLGAKKSFTHVLKTIQDELDLKSLKFRQALQVSKKQHDNLEQFKNLWNIHYEFGESLARLQLLWKETQRYLVMLPLGMYKQLTMQMKRKIYEVTCLDIGPLFKDWRQVTGTKEPTNYRLKVRPAATVFQIVMNFPFFSD
eukprot:GHVS01086425.1.p1 GENE.GHVS01086425.1~~GHVS01086425.1.p1  ORF type:complete len:691 (-),score=63.42 GHVS01086425.1:915-2987(-)